MKLKSKQTGEIMEFDAVLVAKDVKGNEVAHLEYNSIDKFLEEWEDAPEEPKGIKSVGNISSSVHIEMGSKEEAEIAVRKLRAWQRLKDKGFRFDGWEELQAKMDIDGLMLFNRDVIDTDNVIGFRMDDYHDCIKYLNICFGGEE